MPANPPLSSGPLERRRAAAALDIERAAMAYLAENDADTVTVEQLAVAAGISRRTFYRYFDTIDDVINSMPRRTVRRVANALRVRPLTEPLSEAFIAAVRSMVDAHEDLEIGRLIRLVQRRSPDAWGRALARLRAYGVKMFADILAERLSAQGRDASYAPLIAEMLVAVMVHAPGRAKRSGKNEIDTEDFARALGAITEALSDVRPKRARKTARKRSA